MRKMMDRHDEVRGGNERSTLERGSRRAPLSKKKEGRVTCIMIDSSGPARGTGHCLRIVLPEKFGDEKQ